MIRVVITGRSSERGRFPYRIEIDRNRIIENESSKWPLLDACRTVIAIGGDPLAEIALFRPGRTSWDLKTTVGYGATRIVNENRRGFQQFNKDSTYGRKED